MLSDAACVFGLVCSGGAGIVGSRRTRLATGRALRGCQQSDDACDEDMPCLAEASDQAAGQQIARACRRGIGCSHSGDGERTTESDPECIFRGRVGLVCLDADARSGYACLLLLLL